MDLHPICGRRAQTEHIGGIYEQLTPEQLEGIQAVAMDMWDPYIAATLKYVPGAQEKIVFDKFHISKKLNEGVDKVRRPRAQGPRVNWRRYT